MLAAEARELGLVPNLDMEALVGGLQSSTMGTADP